MEDNRNPRTVSQIELLKMSRQGLQTAENELKNRMIFGKRVGVEKEVEREGHEEESVTDKD